MHALFHPQQLTEETRDKIKDFCALWEQGENVKIKTSGSTGNPKELSFTKDQLIASARKTLDYFSLNETCTALLCLSPETIGGKMMLVRSIVANYKLLICEPTLDPFLNISESIDFVAMVPAQLACVLANESSLEKLKKVNTILIGGADIHPDISEKLKKEGIRAFQSYGMTETVSHVALREIGGDQAYCALPGIHFTMNNDCLVIHYPALQKSPIETNDCVELLSSTSFIWKGRADFVVNSGGKKIHVEALEKRLAPFIHGRFILGAIPHAIWGEALIILMENENELDKTQLGKLFQKHEVPKYFCTAPFILTENGKIQRRLTLAQIQENEWISL